MRVIKDGFKKEYVCTCKTCHSIIGYTDDDVRLASSYDKFYKIANSVKDGASGIECPICKNVIMVDLK